MLPGSHPMAALEAALLRSTIDAPDTLADQLAEPVTGLLRAALRILPEGSCLLLLIDQFEELFTLVESESERAGFLDLLGVALDDPHKRVKVVLTLRADYYERPLTYPAFARRLNERIVNVTALAPEEFEAAAIEPMRRAGVEMEPALLASLLADVVGQPGALPLFQYTLTMLFERRSDDSVSLQHYRAMGGLRGAMTERADELMDQLSESEQDIARQLFLRLVTTSADGEWSRRRVDASELISLPLDRVSLQHVIETFSSQRLLASDRNPLTGSPTIEVAHEALISQWPRFKAWVDEDAQGLRLLTHLREASHAWDDGGEDEGDLYRGARLEVILDWVEATEPVLSELEDRFLGEASDVRESELDAQRRSLARSQRQNRRLRRLLALIGTTAVLALLLGVVALQARGRAAGARTVAETGRLSAEAATLASSNRQVALLMAAEAYNRDPGPSTLGALQRVLTGSGNLVAHFGQAAYRRSIWSRDGRLLLGMRADGVDIFEFETGRSVGSINVDTSAVGAFDISPDGRLLAVATSGTFLQVFDLGTREALGRPLDHGSVVRAVRFSPDGARLATGDRSGFLRLWDSSFFDSTGQRPLFQVAAHPETDIQDVKLPEGVINQASHEPESLPVGVNGIAFSDDGSVVATTGGFFVRSWTTDRLERLADIQVDRPTEGDDRFTGRPSEIFLVSATHAVIRANRFMQHYDLETGALIHEYELDLADGSGTSSSLQSLGVAFTDGRVAVSDLDAVSIIDIDTGNGLLPTFDLQAGSTAANISFSPDGRT